MARRTIRSSIESSDCPKNRGEGRKERKKERKNARREISLLLRGKRDSRKYLVCISSQ
jgi:hypothetical protein